MHDLLRRVSLWVVLGASVLIGGCASLGTVFTVDVDTKNSDPLIYGPGTHPDKPLQLALDGVEMACDLVGVKVTSIEPSVEFALGRHLRYDAGGFKPTPIAYIDKENAARLASSSTALQGITNAFNDLSQTQTPCPLSKASAAADRLYRQLPRPYSAMLRLAYNHRLWPQPPRDTAWISLDLQAGMRLRMENSLPISPHGINSEKSHPSSFAAPTYMYFHGLSAAELCDPGARSSGKRPGYCSSARPVEDVMLVSASGGLARFGLAQEWEGTPGEQKAHDTSGLIDVLERGNEGPGAWRYWRLWLPSHRETPLNSRITDGADGSKEDLKTTPFLVAGNEIDDLGTLPSNATSTPCNSTTAEVNWRCHRLLYRAVPVPEIEIMVNQMPKWVPVGTTLRDVLAHRLHRDGPWAADTATALRALDEVHVFRRQGGSLHAVVPAKLETTKHALRFLRLQLLPGDEVRWP